MRGAPCSPPSLCTMSYWLPASSTKCSVAAVRGTAVRRARAAPGQAGSASHRAWPGERLGRRPPAASTKSMVAQGSSPVATRSSFASASVPALAPRPYWCGMQASWKARDKCWAKARAIRRRNTNARTRPLDLRRATVRPMRTAARHEAAQRLANAVWRIA